MHAVVSRGLKNAGSAEIERRVALRLERQKVLVSESAPNCHVVLDEAALRRPYGGREVMRGQLQHLIDVSERPNVTLQLMPFSAGGHAGESGSFTMLSFSESDLSDVVYLEQLTSALYLGGGVRRGCARLGRALFMRRDFTLEALQAPIHHANCLESQVR